MLAGESGRGLVWARMRTALARWDSETPVCTSVFVNPEIALVAIGIVMSTVVATV